MSGYRNLAHPYRRSSFVLRPSSFVLFVLEFVGVSSFVARRSSFLEFVGVSSTASSSVLVGGGVCRGVICPRGGGGSKQGHIRRASALLFPDGGPLHRAVQFSWIWDCEMFSIYSTYIVFNITYSPDILELTPQNFKRHTLSRLASKIGQIKCRQE